MQMDTTIALNLKRVLYIEAVEGDGILANRRGERILQKADLVIIEIDIREHILHYHIQHVACLEQVVDA